MKRVTIEEMREATQAVPLTPVMGTYFDVPTRDVHASSNRQVSREQVLCGCPLTIITCYRHPSLIDEIEGVLRNKAHQILVDAVYQEFPTDYAKPFTQGYDIGHSHAYGDANPGFQDGLLIREHFPPNREVLV